MNASRWIVVGGWAALTASVITYVIAGQRALEVAAIMAALGTCLVVLILLSLDLWRGDT